MQTEIKSIFEELTQQGVRQRCGGNLHSGFARMVFDDKGGMSRVIRRTEDCSLNEVELKAQDVIFEVERKRGCYAIDIYIKNALQDGKSEIRKIWSFMGKEEWKEEIARLSSFLPYGEKMVIEIINLVIFYTKCYECKSTY